MGRFITFRCVKAICYWDYLFRSISHWKACFLYCRRYDSFKDKAFVTGSASDWRCVFSPIPFKGKTGLRASGSCCRMLYPFGIKKKLNEFAALLSAVRSDFHLVTVKNQKYYVYRYEGKLNGIENAVVLLSYPEKHLENRKHCGHFSAQMYPCQRMKSWIITYADGQSKYFSGKVRINWHWTDIRYVLRRESEGTGCWCHLHILYAWQEQVNSALLKKAITESAVSSSWKSIVIFFNVQGQVMILIRLWN